MTRTQPVPGGGSTPMAFGAGLVPAVSQGVGPHGHPLHGAAVPPGFQGAGPHGLPHQAVPPGFQGVGPQGVPNAYGGFPCGCNL